MWVLDSLLCFCWFEWKSKKPSALWTKRGMLTGSEISLEIANQIPNSLDQLHIWPLLQEVTQSNDTKHGKVSLSPHLHPLRSTTANAASCNLEIATCRENKHPIECLAYSQWNHSSEILSWYKKYISRFYSMPTAWAGRSLHKPRNLQFIHGGTQSLVWG